MPVVTVNLSGRAYDIIIEAGLFGKVGASLLPYARNNRLLVVSDENVAATYGTAFLDNLSAAGMKGEIFILPPGETAKSWDRLAALVDWLLDHQVERRDHIIALGGGVVGDVTGFAAHIVKRGCNFIQIPTSLLAQVDSSVGGKTAINTGAGKNLVGAFHQPSLVLIDPEILKSLPERQLAAGFAEVVKYGIINDPGFFAYCEEHADAFMAGDPAISENVIRHSVTAKAQIVAADETETTGTRALLNLGHTFGHALEAETGFSDRLLHGEAVATGMVLALRYSARLGLCPVEDADRTARLLARAGLPTTLAAAGVDCPGQRLVDHMRHDKKMAGGTLPFLLTRAIGQAFLADNVDLADVAIFLDEERARP